MGGWGGERIVLPPDRQWKLNKMERRANAKTKPVVDSESLSLTRIPNGTNGRGFSSCKRLRSLKTPETAVLQRRQKL